MIERVKTAIAYLRVSTDDQNNGLEAQRAQIESWAARQGVSVTSWHVDPDVSGATPLHERPGLLEAMAALHGASFLVVAKRDRLARSVMIATMLERLVADAGASIVSADGVTTENTPEGELLRGMLDLFAQYERALIRARTRAALARKKARGERMGRPRLGERVADGRYATDDTTSQVVARVRQLHADGLSTRAIVAALAAEGLRGTKGPLQQTQVARILRRAA